MINQLTYKLYLSLVNVSNAVFHSTSEIKDKIKIIIKTFFLYTAFKFLHLNRDKDDKKSVIELFLNLNILVI